MKHPLGDDRIREEAALYALGAMSQREARAFEDHLLEGCSVCAYELAEFEMVAEALSFGAESVTPRDKVRDLLLERIKDESPNAPDLTAHYEKTPPRGGDRRSALRLIKRTDYFRWALVASLVLLALAAFQVWQARHTISDLKGQLAAGGEETIWLRSRLEAQSQRVRELEQTRQILKSPGSRLIKMDVQSPAPSPSEIYWDRANRLWAVTLDLPPAPAGKVYQLWFVTAQAKVSAGLIESDEQGHGYAVVSVPPDLNQIVAAAVTLEPDGGSAQPTMPIYAIGEINRIN
jgi:anti-sigma-K factor RskA